MPVTPGASAAIRLRGQVGARATWAVACGEGPRHHVMAWEGRPTMPPGSYITTVGVQREPRSIQARQGGRRRGAPVPRATVINAKVTWRPAIDGRARSNVLGPQGVAAAMMVVSLSSCSLYPSRCAVLNPLALGRTAREGKGRCDSALLALRRREGAVNIVSLNMMLVGVFECHSKLRCPLGTGV